MAIYIDLPIKMVIFHSYVSLPEGKHYQTSNPVGNPQTSNPRNFSRAAFPEASEVPVRFQL